MTLETENTEYCVIKLYNGEDIISQVSGLKNLQNNIVYLIDPYTIKIFNGPANTGYQQIAITKWNPFTHDEKIALSLDNVLTISNVKPDLLEYYIRVSVNEHREEPLIEQELEKEIEEDSSEEANEAFDRIVEMIKAKRNITFH